MKIERARIVPFRLALRSPIATAHGVIATREGFLLALESEVAVGWGEASPIAGFGLERRDRCGEALEALARRLVAGGRLTLAEHLASAEAEAAGAPAARAAADTALHDLAARAAGESLTKSLMGCADRPVPTRVPVHALIAGSSPAEVEANARAALASGFECCKLKVGAGDLTTDVARVAAARAALGADVRLRLDANGGFDEREALRAIDRFAEFGIELIEQPLPARELSAAARVRERSPVPVAADESATSLAAATAVIDAGAADLLVVKPGACGGLGPGARIVRRARQAGLDVYVTSLLDGAVGVAAATHFAASLAPPPRACGLATSSLLVQDWFDLSEPVEGGLPLPKGAGLGFEPDMGRQGGLGAGAVLEVRA